MIDVDASLHILIPILADYTPFVWSRLSIIRAVTLWWTYKKLLKMTIEIVDFP